MGEIRRSAFESGDEENVRVLAPGVKGDVNEDLASTLCPLCGTNTDRSTARVLEAHRHVSRAVPVLDDLTAARWVRDYDAAWLEQDWDSLARQLAPSVEFVVPGLADVLIGREAVLEALRNAVCRMVIHEYNTTNITGYDRGPVGIVVYHWRLDCSVGSRRLQTTGRDVLLLSEAGGRWVLTWRGQFAG